MQACRFAVGIGLAVMVLAPTAARGETITLEAEAALLSPDRVEVISQDRFPSTRGVSLKAGSVERDAPLPAGEGI